MHDKYRVKFSADMINHFGGARGAAEALARIGVNVKVKTLQKQQERGNIPADMVASLLLASVKVGMPYNRGPIDPYNYLLERKE